MDLVEDVDLGNVRVWAQLVRKWEFGCEGGIFAKREDVGRCYGNGACEGYTVPSSVNGWRGWLAVD